MIQSILGYWAVACSGGALGYAVAFQLLAAGTVRGDMWGWFVAAGALGGVWWLRWAARLSPELTPRALGVAPLPWLGAAGMCAVPGVWSMLGCAFFAGWGVFREIELLPEDDGWWRRWKKYKVAGFIFLLSFGAWLVWSAYAGQVAAMEHLSLFCDDWWGCMDAALNCLSGDWFYSNLTGANFLGYSFSPLAVALLLPCALFCGGVEAFFLFSALLLYGNAILIYWFARVKGLSGGIAGLLALSVLLSSALAWMPVGQGGGFHPVFLFQPMLILFFILREKDRRDWAMVLWALSLLICESAAWIWCGIGVVLYFQRERRNGAIMGAVSLLWLLWVSQKERFGLPYLDNAAWEGGRWGIRSIWGACREWEWAALAVQLLMPVILLVPFRWHLLPACVPAFVASGLLLGTGSSSPQFGSYLMLIYVSAVYSCSVVRSMSMRTRWLEMLACGGVPVGGKCKNTLALLAGSLAAGGMAFMLFELRDEVSFSGRGYSDEIRAVQECVPAGERLNVDAPLAAPFALRNTLFMNAGGFFHISDYVWMDLFAERPDAGQREQVRGFLLSHGYEVVYRSAREGHLFVLLARDAKRMAVNGLIWMERADFNKLGEPLGGVNADLGEVRVLRTAERAIFFLRPQGNLESDLEVTTVLKLPDGRGVRHRNLFGNGVTPVYLAGENAVMAWSETWPRGGFFPMETELKVELRLYRKVEWKHLRFPIARGEDR